MEFGFAQNVFSLEPYSHFTYCIWMSGACLLCPLAALLAQAPERGSRLCCCLQQLSQAPPLGQGPAFTTFWPPSPLPPTPIVFYYESCQTFNISNKDFSPSFFPCPSSPLPPSPLSSPFPLPSSSSPSLSSPSSFQS